VPDALLLNRNLIGKSYGIRGFVQQCRVVGVCVSGSHQFATRACFNSVAGELRRRVLYETLPW